MHAIHASAATVPPVVSEGVQKLLPGPAPPPPPFTATQFGLDMWDAASSIDFGKGSKVLHSGATEGILYGYKKMDDAEGIYKTPARVTQAGIHFAFDRPPPPPVEPQLPTAAAALQERDEAIAAAGRANEELVRASSSMVQATAELMRAKMAHAAGIEESANLLHLNVPKGVQSPSPPVRPSPQPALPPISPPRNFGHFFGWGWGLSAEPEAHSISGDTSAPLRLYVLAIVLIVSAVAALSIGRKGHTGWKQTNLGSQGGAGARITSAALGFVPIYSYNVERRSENHACLGPSALQAAML